MRKNKKYLVFIGVLLISIAIFKFVPVDADSGFDSSWDSGSSSSSWSSDSSWDNDYSSSSSSSYSSSSGDVDGAWLIISIFIYFVLFGITYSSVVKKSSNRGKDTLPVSTKPDIKLIDNIDVKSMLSRSSIEEFSVDKFYNKVFEIYKDVQIAWMNRDIDSVRNVLTDEMYNMYKSQVETLKLHGQINIMDQITFIEAGVISINDSDDKQVVEVMLHVSCKDYLVDENKNLLKGNVNKINDYIYKLTFIKTMKKISKCPKCGAELDNHNSITCKYCRSRIVSDSYDWTLAKKEMIYQK